MKYTLIDKNVNHFYCELSGLVLVQLMSSLLGVCPHLPAAVTLERMR